MKLKTHKIIAIILTVIFLSDVIAPKDIMCKEQTDRQCLAVWHHPFNIQEASLHADITRCMTFLMDRNVTSMGDLLKLKKREAVRRKKILINCDIKDAKKVAYYIFLKKDAMYCRVTTDKKVNDKLGRLLFLLTEQLKVPFIKSKITRIEVKEKVFYCQYFSLSEGKRELFDIFLDWFFPQIDWRKAEPNKIDRRSEISKEPFNKKITGLNDAISKYKPIYIFVNLLLVVFSASMLPAQIFLFNTYVHIVRKKLFYIYLGYLATFLPIVFLMPVLILCNLPFWIAIVISGFFMINTIVLLCGLDAYVYKIIAIKLLAKLNLVKRLEYNKAMLELELMGTPYKIIVSNDGKVEISPLYRMLAECIYLIEDTLSELKKDKVKASKPVQSQYARFVKKDEAEKGVMKINLDKFGKVKDLSVLGDIGKLSEILDEKDPSKLKLVIAAKTDSVLLRLKQKYGSGIFMAAKEIVLVDNLGGLDSVLKDEAGTTGVYHNGQILIDIDALKNDLVYGDIIMHEIWESMLELVELNPGVREVTAIYQNLKDFIKLPDRDKYSLIAFLQNKNNGLDSADYGEVLQFILDNNTSGDDLILLAINFVLSNQRYLYLRKSLKGVLVSQVKDADRALNLTIEVCDDFAKAAREWEPIKNEAKNAETKTKILMKFKLLINGMNEKSVEVVDLLQKGNKFVRLDMDELIKPENEYIMLWLENLLKCHQGNYPFVLFSRTQKTSIEGLLSRYTGLEARRFLTDRDLAGMEIPRENICTLYELRGKRPEAEDLQASMAMPLFYSIGGVYMAAQVAVASGNIDDLQDETAKKALNSFYESLFGKDFGWEKLFNGGLWPPVEKISAIVETLHSTVKQIEISA